MNKIILNIVRIIFISIIMFEAANMLGILNFTLEFSWIGLFLTALAVWIMIETVNFFVKKRYDYILPAYVFLIPALNILLDAFGDIFKLYAKYPWYDQLAHFLGGVSAAGVLFFVIASIIQYKKINISDRFSALLALSLANLFGILYEIEEYLESYYLHNNRLGDRFDTPNDLLLNLLGTILCISVIYYFRALNRKRFPKEVTIKSK